MLSGKADKIVNNQIEVNETTFQCFYSDGSNLPRICRIWDAAFRRS